MPSPSVRVLAESLSFGGTGNQGLREWEFKVRRDTERHEALNRMARMEKEAST